MKIINLEYARNFIARFFSIIVRSLGLITIKENQILSQEINELKLENLRLKKDKNAKNANGETPEEIITRLRRERNKLKEGIEQMASELRKLDELKSENARLKKDKNAKNVNSETPEGIIARLRRERNKLKERIEQMASELQKLDELKSENARLREE